MSPSPALFSMSPISPRGQKRELRRFQHGVRTIVATAVAMAVFAAGAVFVADPEPFGWLPVTMMLLAVVAAIGFADVLATAVWLDDEQLFIRSGFRTRHLPRSAIDKVEWSAGCPVSVRTPAGWVALPALGDTRLLADTIRQWLRAAPSAAAIPEAAVRIARRIVDGEIDAIEGARQIRKEVLDPMPDRIPDALWPFKSNASAIEDCEWDARDSGTDHGDLIAACQAEIVRAATDLCSAGKKG